MPQNGIQPVITCCHLHQKILFQRMKSEGLMGFVCRTAVTIEKSLFYNFVFFSFVDLLSFLITVAAFVCLHRLSRSSLFGIL